MIPTLNVEKILQGNPKKKGKISWRMRYLCAHPTQPGSWGHMCVYSGPMDGHRWGTLAALHPGIITVVARGGISISNSGCPDYLLITLSKPPL